ncbi:NBAS subunit of NRZ tethering complex-like [Saccoglossus kowalevskii]
MASCADDSEEENILYDVLVHEEWPQESELLVKAIKERPRGSVVGRFASVAERSLWTFVRSVGYPLRSTTSCTLPNGLVQLVNNQINWQIAVSSDSRLIAILQDTCIEIRSHRDEYASIVGKCTVSVCKDPYPQWRKVTWNRDSTMIGFSDSSGNVQVFDVVGSLLCTIPKDETYMHTVPLDINVPIDLSCAIASLIFVEYKPNQQWSAKLLVINYQGFLRSYFVSPTGGSERSHTFLFTHLYPRGVCSVVYNQKHAMLIVGGPSAAEEHFDHSFFRKFRSQNIVETAVEYSQDGDWRALDAIFTYHGRYTSLHRLAILGNFPETMSPFEYRDLLPEGGLLEDNTNVLNWEYPSRNKDWCEEDFCTSQINPHPEDYGAFLYEENPHLDKYRTTNPSDKLLTEWYKFRACEIEQFSRQVDNALELINLGIERNISDLNDLHTDLVTMETLVYECGTEPAITFEEFRELSDIEKLQMLMAKPTKDMYIKNVRQWLVPFLQRCDRKKQGSAQTLLRLYLVSMAKDDLTFPVMIFENSRPDKPDAIIRDVQQVFSIAIDCIYNCERDDQLNLAWTLFQSLPQKGYGLLCSGRLENIKLAGDLMDRGMDELDGAGSSRLMMLNEIKVPYDRSVELVLNAAMEYFNSSSNLTDPCMELAKACLHLIADVPATIRAELDLIEALQLLSNYDVKILPLQGKKLYLKLVL